MANKMWTTIQPNTQSPEATLYYKNFHSDYAGQLNLAMCISLAATALTAKNLRYIMTHMNNDHICNNLVLPYLTHWNNNGFNFWCESNQLERLPRRHWSESAHKAAFEYIKNSGNIDKLK
jgi:hypothetical protein